MNFSNATKNFFIIALFTMIGYGILRYVGWIYYAKTTTWNSLNTDYWHHWELGFLLLFFAALALKKFPFWQNIIYAIASGQIIDEFTYAIFPQETISDFQWQLQHWYWPIGFEIIIFLFLCFAIHKLQSGTKQVQKNVKAILISAGIVAIANLIYTDIIKSFLLD